MGSKKRPSTVSAEIEPEPEPDNKASDAGASKVVQGEPQTKKNLKPMERRKKRKTLDKERHQNESDIIKKKVDISKPVEVPLVVKEAALPATGFHVDVFRDLAAADVEVRKKAAERLASELVEVQRVFEMGGGEGEGEKVKLEAEKDDGLEGCAPSLGYAIRRLIRGVSSSREVMICIDVWRRK